MRIAYHSTASALQPAQLSAWLTATLALSAVDFDALASPGVLLTITDPDYPFAFERQRLATDRQTLGGVGYSRQYGGQRSGDWHFSRVHAVEIAAWRLWYEATAGLRLPFVVEIGSDRYRAIAPGPFPLTLTAFERWSGALPIREALGWT